MGRGLWMGEGHGIDGVHKKDLSTAASRWSGAVSILHTSINSLHNYQAARSALYHTMQGGGQERSKDNEKIYWGRGVRQSRPSEARPDPPRQVLRSPFGNPAHACGEVVAGMRVVVDPAQHDQKHEEGHGGFPEVGGQAVRGEGWGGAEEGAADPEDGP